MKVSVLMATYNHEKYIAQAIESVLLQQTDFEVNLLIGEDCSKDSTRQIIESYTKRFPKVIKPVYQEKNVGAGTNFAQLYKMAKGDYIAELEGDDYWVDPLKLQKQLMFLETHNEYSMCFHNVIVFHQDGSQKAHPFHNSKAMRANYTLADFLQGNFIQACSVLYRKDCVPDMPSWINTMPMGDWPLNVLHAEKGNVGYIDEIMAVYRVHNSSVWASQGLPQRIRFSIDAAVMLDEGLSSRYHGTLSTTHARWHADRVNAFLKINDQDSAVKAIFEAFEEIKEPAYINPYLQFFLSVFVNKIVSLIEKGNESQAVEFYDSHIKKFPQIQGIENVISLMDKLKLRLNLSQV